VSLAPLPLQQRLLQREHVLQSAPTSRPPLRKVAVAGISTSILPISDRAGWQSRVQPDLRQRSHRALPLPLSVGRHSERSRGHPLPLRRASPEFRPDPGRPMPAFVFRNQPEVILQVKRESTGRRMMTSHRRAQCACISRKAQNHGETQNRHDHGAMNARRIRDRGPSQTVSVAPPMIAITRNDEGNLAIGVIESAQSQREDGRKHDRQ